MTSVIDFLDDPALLAPHFWGPSWNRWRAALKGAFALPMTLAERELFEEIAGGRAPPHKPLRELVAAVGRGGGKDSIAAALATWIAVTADTSGLRTGEFATVFCFAVDREQAAIALDYIRGFFEDIPLLAGMVRIRNRRQAIDDSTIELTNRVKITVCTNNRRAPRGRTIACGIFDEAAFWYSQDYVNADFETDAAVSPGLARFPNSLKIIISSVNKRSGLLYDRYARFYGRDDADTLVVAGTSLEFNPTRSTPALSSASWSAIRREPARSTWADGGMICRSSSAASWSRRRLSVGLWCVRWSGKRTTWRRLDVERARLLIKCNSLNLI
jgi:hypothetical protein